ncbi:hypothetical protein [Streptomyces albidochromogenes]|uniref:Uncharacterized protein n=1 Tax=Streptomyces albidochromogenes TaxID=329524 RepID=A0ABW6FF02_9ACTN
MHRQFEPLDDQRCRAQRVFELLEDLGVRAAQLFVAFFQLYIEGEDAGVGLGELVLEASVFGAEGVGPGEGRAQFFLDGLSLRPWCPVRPRLASAARPGR